MPIKRKAVKVYAYNRKGAFRFNFKIRFVETGDFQKDLKQMKVLARKEANRILTKSRASFQARYGAYLPPVRMLKFENGLKINI